MQIPPHCDIAFIGGSSTLSIEMPEDLMLSEITIEITGQFFDTPFGLAGPFKIFQLQGDTCKKRIISCQMHNWKTGLTRRQSSLQAFWVFKQAQVKYVLSEGGVGAVNHLLKPRDLIIPHDYMDFSMRKDVAISDEYLLIMRQPVCPDFSKVIIESAKSNWSSRVFDLGIYANTDGRHFESVAEVNYMKMAGADIVGQSFCPEVYLAREIGACYAGLYMVVNHAEGIVTPWEHEELSDIFYSESKNFGKIIIDALKTEITCKNCQCQELRKETLLNKTYQKEENN